MLLDILQVLLNILFNSLHCFLLYFFKKNLDFMMSYITCNIYFPYYIITI